MEHTRKVNFGYQLNKIKKLNHLLHRMFLSIINKNKRGKKEIFYEQSFEIPILQKFKKVKNRALSKREGNGRGQFVFLRRAYESQGRAPKKGRKNTIKIWIFGVQFDENKRFKKKKKNSNPRVESSSFSVRKHNARASMYIETTLTFFT